MKALVWPVAFSGLYLRTACSALAVSYSGELLSCRRVNIGLSHCCRLQFLCPAPGLGLRYLRRFCVAHQSPLVLSRSSVGQIIARWPSPLSYRVYDELSVYNPRYRFSVPMRTVTPLFRLSVALLCHAT